MLSYDDILEQIESIKKSIDFDYQSIEGYRKSLSGASQHLAILQIIATIQGNVATKQLQITMLQLGLRDI